MHILIIIDLSNDLFQNIFPSFAKGKMLGAGRQHTGPEWGTLLHFLLVLESVIKYAQVNTKQGGGKILLSYSGQGIGCRVVDGQGVESDIHIQAITSSPYRNNRYYCHFTL